MYCSNCGSPMEDTCKFCPNCGAKAEKSERITSGEIFSQQEQEKEFPVTERITLFPDGKYRWIRKVSLLGNASQLKFLIRCSGFTCFAVSVLLCWGAELIEFGIWECLKIILLFTGVGVLATLLVYWLVALSVGHQFRIFYEMDENQLLISRKLTGQQNLRWCTAGYIAGLMADPVFSMDYFNLMSDHNHSILLKNVKSMRWEPKRQSEKLGGDFGLRRIYVDVQDTALFAAHLKKYSPNLKM